MPASAPTRARASVCLVLVGGLLVAQLCDALRMVNLDAPETALQGDTIRLSCFFNLHKPAANHRHAAQQQTATAQKSKLQADERARSSSSSSISFATLDKHDADDEASGESEQLYAIKWYKDEREFFRYLAQEWPRKQWLPMDGVAVDVDKSDNHTVVLKSVSLRTSGLFRCEVSTDAPFFVTKSIERKLLVYSLLNEGPAIEIPKSTTGPRSAATYYSLGDHVELVCSAPESKPAAALDWIINETLNLSSLPAGPAGGQVASVFKTESQRFVRVPLVGGGSSSSGRAPMTSPIPSSRDSNGRFAYASYELLNGTLAARQQEKLGPAVSFTGSLDQLLEVATTRLNFTVDTNLLQLIGTLTSRPTKPAVDRLSRSPGDRRETIGEGRPRARSKNHKLVIKVKCVARILHLSMSDEIRVQLLDSSRSRERDDTLTPVSAQKRQRQLNDGNSAMASRMQTSSLLVCLFVSFLVCIESRGFIY